MRIRISNAYAEQLLKEGKRVLGCKENDYWLIRNEADKERVEFYAIEAKVDVAVITRYLQLEQEKAEIEKKMDQIKSDFIDDAMAYNSIGGYSPYSVTCGDNIMTCKRTTTPSVLLGNTMLQAFGAMGGDLITVKPEQYDLATKVKAVICAAVTGEYGDISSEEYLKGLCAFDDNKYKELSKKLRVKPETNKEVFKVVLGIDAEAAENAANALEMCRRRDTLLMLTKASPFDDLDSFIAELKKYVQVSVKDSVTVTN